MNYYPYYPVVSTRPSIFGMFRNLNLGSILSGTQKALNLANQAIPLIKQASPMIKNAKTMFKVINEFKKPDIIKTEKNNKTEITKDLQKKVITKDNNVEVSFEGPTFFI